MDKALASFVEISKALNSVLEVGPLLENIIDSAISSVGVERGILFLKAPDGSLQPRAARNVEKDTLANAEQISRSIIQEVASSGKYFLSSNIQEDPDLHQRPSVRDFKILSVLCVPLVNQDKTIGTLYLDSRKAAKVFTMNDVQFLQTFANLAAIAIHNAHLYEASKDEARYWQEEASGRHGFENIIHVSEAIERLCTQARNIARTTVSVLLTGESGTGKELFARAIHYSSPRSARRFMPINCSALPEEILESELFGVKKGAYTGAVADTKGIFEEADGGTILLDEIADMQPALQSKLLRVLQEGEIRRVGDTQYRFTNVRVISATNKKIHEEIKAGRFREDLYYRLCGFEFCIPPLRERREDIPHLAVHFANQFCVENKLPSRTFSPQAIEALQEYPYPGNVRELQNIVRKSILLCADEHVLSRVELPRLFPDVQSEHFDEATRAHLITVLEKANWNQTRAAEFLGLNRTTLQAKMKKLGIEKPS